MAALIDVIIVGGGASGLFSAILLAKKGYSVTILEQNKVVGKKLSITGNGKCNYTNLYQTKACYRSSDLEKAFRVLRNFDEDKILDFFKSIGIIPDVKKGRCTYNTDSGYVYPSSGSGKDFTLALQEECLSLGVKIRTNTKVVDVKKENNIFLVTVGENLYSYKANYVIIAVGGLAEPKSGSDGNLYEVLKSSGHKFKKQLPALTSLSSNRTELKELSGIRTTVCLSLFSDSELIAEEYGELQFSNRGLSGIPAMQLSGIAARLIDEKKAVNCVIDFFPSLEREDLLKHFLERRERLGKRKVEHFFLGMLNEKLALVINKYFFKGCVFVSEVTDSILESMTDYLKSFEVPIVSVGDFYLAQTTSGGILLSEVDESLCSLHLKNLFFAGEILDVDGLCGGYNLTWAWASAFQIAEKIGEKNE